MRERAVERENKNLTHRVCGLDSFSHKPHLAFASVKPEPPELRLLALTAHIQAWCHRSARPPGQAHGRCLPLRAVTPAHSLCSDQRVHDHWVITRSDPCRCTEGGDASFPGDPVGWSSLCLPLHPPRPASWAGGGSLAPGHWAPLGRAGLFPGSSHAFLCFHGWTQEESSQSY